VLAAHTCLNGTAPYAFQPAVTVTVFPGWCLQAAIAVGSGATVDAMVFIAIMLMKPIGAFWAARTKTA